MAIAAGRCRLGGRQRVETSVPVIGFIQKIVASGEGSAHKNMNDIEVRPAMLEPIGRALP